METLKYVRDEINNFITGHTVFESFTFDDISNYPENASNIKFPSLFISPKTLLITNSSINYLCDIVVADMLTDEIDYDLKCSDNAILMSEFLTYFDENNEFRWFIKGQDNNFEYFVNEVGDTTGIFGPIIIKIPFAWNHENIRMKK